MLKGAVVFIFASLWIAFYTLLYKINRDRAQIKNRIEIISVMETDKEKSEMDATFLERIIKPVYNAITKILVKLTPVTKLNAMNKKLDMAGLLKDTTVAKWLYKMNMIIFIAAGITGILSYLLEPNLMKAAMMMIMIILLIQASLRFYLARKIDQRKKSILKNLPFTLDLITVSVEAGLSFDGAMARVINNIPGEVSDEFAKTLKETKMGIERKIALRNMSDRCDIKELSMFVASLIQADGLGVGLGNVLRIESEQMRERRRQSAREKAMKAPIKMLFPLIVFIFPTIFVIVLGPAVIRIMRMMAGE